jgi:hypothetical protein
LGTNSYGPPFNANGGGWYAIERTDSFIKAWFWERTNHSVPPDVKSHKHTVNTDKWGIPAANFPDTSCDIGSAFDANNIIINLTFCLFDFALSGHSRILLNDSSGGDRAGNADIYAASGCPSTCIGMCPYCSCIWVASHSFL